MRLGWGVTTDLLVSAEVGVDAEVAAPLAPSDPRHDLLRRAILVAVVFIAVCAASAVVLVTSILPRYRQRRAPLDC